jgi:replication-associated recombination protein RarA
MKTVSPSPDTPQFELKPLSKDGVDTALGKAEHYRLLNQPRLAESICLDVLEVDPGNQRAAIVLLLALTDQFRQSSTKASKQALELANSLKDEYSKTYYTGIIHERQGAAALGSSLPGADFDAYMWYREAMQFYEKANEINKGENNDPILRWNTCARIIMECHLRERPSEDYQTMLE